MDDRFAEQTAKIAEMYPSRWKAAASNALSVLSANTAKAKRSAAALALVKRAKALKRIEKLIARGMLAPHSIGSRVMGATLISQGHRRQFNISFVDGAWLATGLVPGLEADRGSHHYEQTAWNQATLELMAEGGGTLTLNLVFRTRRVIVSGESVRGSFVPH